MSEQYKVVIVGDGSVGKTTFVNRLFNSDYNKTYIPTMGANVHTVNVKTTTSDTIYTMTLWDTAGQEKFGGLRDAYYNNCDACIILFSLDDKSTYRHVLDWYKEVRRVCDNNDIPIIIVGNKSDLKDDLKFKIPSNAFYDKKGISLVKLSSKTGTNIYEPIKLILSKLKKDDKLDIESINK